MFIIIRRRYTRVGGVKYLSWANTKYLFNLITRYNKVQGVYMCVDSISHTQYIILMLSFYFVPYLYLFLSFVSFLTFISYSFLFISFYSPRGLSLSSNDKFKHILCSISSLPSKSRFSPLRKQTLFRFHLLNVEINACLWLSLKVPFGIR